LARNNTTLRAINKEVVDVGWGRSFYHVHRVLRACFKGRRVPFFPRSCLDGIVVVRPNEKPEYGWTSPSRHTIVG
jgi:hypothetical protein